MDQGVAEQAKQAQEAKVVEKPAEVVKPVV